MGIKLLNNQLKSIKILGRSADDEQAELMLKYVHCLMEHSGTPELRSYWAMVYKWINKHIGGR